MNKNYLLILMSLVIILPFVSSAPTNITSCGSTISTPGEYELNSTLNGTTTCLTITSDDVSIDCKGNSIEYGSAGGNGAIGINAILGVVPRENLSVKNCMIRDINVSGTTGYGIMMTRYSNSNIFNNTILTNGSSSNFGLYLTTSSNNNIFENNTIYSLGTTTTNYGIHLLSSSRDNTIRGNNVVSKGTTTSYALYLLTGSDNNFVYNNSLTTISTTGTGNTDGHTVYISGSISNIITNNTIDSYSKARNYAVYLLSTANNNTISYNDINNRGNESANYGIYASSSSSNTIKGNNIVLNNGTSANYGIFVSASNLNNVRDNSVYIKGTTGLIGTYGLNSLLNNFENNTLIVNGSGATNYGAFLSASYLTNISNSYIFVNGTTPLYGIYLLGAELNNISNNNVTTFGTTANAPMSLGISSNYNFIFNNTLNSRGTSTLNYGCYLTQANRNTISNNIITTNGTTTNYGVYLLTNTKYNIIKYNTISTGGTTTNYGMFLSAASDNQIIGNNITTNGTTKVGTTNNWGLHLAVNSEKNEIHNNTVYTDGGGLNYGFSLITNSRNNSYTGNKVYAGGNGTTNIGAYVSESSYNTFEDNIVSTSANNTGLSYGFYMHSSSRFNNIKTNNISTVGSNSHAFDFLFITPGYPESNTIEDNNLLNISGRDLNFETVSINGTWLIDQNIRNYSFTTLGGLINIKNTSVGEIRFLTPINGTNITFSNSVFIIDNFARIDEHNSFLNKSAEITFYDLPTAATQLRILRNGVECPSTICNNLTSLQAGNITFNVTHGGNYSINSTTLDPIIDLNYPINSFNASSKNIYFNFSVSDDNSTILNCSIYLNNNINQTNSATQNGTVTTFLVSNIAEGNHSWYVSCYDGEYNLGTSSINNFTVNYTISIININFPSNGSYLNNINSVTLNYTAFDTDLNNMTLWLYGDDSLLNISYNITNNTNLLYTWSDLSLGQHNWSIIANNGLKNSSSQNKYFNLINLTINCEAGGPYQEGALVLVQGNISDGLSGVGSQSINASVYKSGVINNSKTLTSLSDGIFQTTYPNLEVANYTLNTSVIYQGINASCFDSFNLSTSGTGSTSTPLPASLILDKIVSLQSLNSTTIIYNITLRSINSGGSNATSTTLNDSDSNSSPYNLGNLATGTTNQTSYSKSYTRNSTNYNISLSLATINATDNSTGNQISANSSLITIIVPATTANTNLTLTKNAQFLSENSTAVAYNLSLTIVNSGGSDLTSIILEDADISLSSSIDLNRTQSYSISGTKTITKISSSQNYEFLKANATHSTVLYESNQLQILIPALSSNSSLALSKLASLHAQTSLNITYNISLVLVNSGGSNATNINITDSDSTSSPYLLNNLTAGQQYQTSYLLTLAKTSSQINYALSNATVYGINQISNNLLIVNSSQVVVNVPAIATNASLSLTKLSSVYSLNITDIVYNITLSLVNSGGSNATNINITDSDSTSSPYLLNNLTAGQSTIRSYLLNFSRASTTSIIVLSNSTAYAVDSISNNQIQSFASSSNITIPGNLTQAYTSASLVLDKIVSFHNLTNTTINYNVTLRLTNKGGINATNTNITDSDSTSSPYLLNNLTAGESVVRSYILNYTRNSSVYSINLSRALSYSTDYLTNNSINANSSIISISIPSTQLNQQLTVVKNAYFNSENSTAVNYTVSIEFVNSGGVDLSSITVIDSDISLNSLIDLNRTHIYNSSSSIIIPKAASNTEKLFVKATATANTVTYESNQINLQIPGYGGPADTIVYAPEKVNVSTSFDSIIEIINQNPDVGQNFIADYWITNNEETINYTAGQQTIYVSASGSTNLTVTLTAPSITGIYRLRALVSYTGGPDLAFDSFEITALSSSGGDDDSSSGDSSSGGGSSGGRGITGNVTEEVVCSSPYIRHGKECCLDVNSNSICDIDESLEIPEIDKTKPEIKENPKEGFSYFDAIGKIYGNTILRITDFIQAKKFYIFISVGALVLIIFIISSAVKLNRVVVKITSHNSSRLNSIIGKEVYAENGNKIGRVKEVYLENHKIYGWLIKPDKKIAKKLRKKNILIKHDSISSIGKIMIIKEEIADHLDKLDYKVD